MIPFSFRNANILLLPKKYEFCLLKEGKEKKIYQKLKDWRSGEEFNSILFNKSIRDFIGSRMSYSYSVLDIFHIDLKEIS